MLRKIARLFPAFALVALPIQAQDFELDLSFDDTAIFEEAVSDSSGGGPDVKATLGFGAVRMGGVTTNSSSLRLDISNNNDLAGLGFLEWSGHLAFDDLTGGAAASVALDKIQLQNSTGKLSWKIGKFPIGWGEVEGMPVLDVLNAGLSLATIGTATADLPGQWFASADYFIGEATLSGFVGLAPEVVHSVSAARTTTDLEFGVRAQVPIEQGQISFYGARLVPQTGVVDLVSTTSSAAPYALAGVSVHKALGAVLLEFDLAAKFGLERAAASGLSAHNRLDASFGLEYAASNVTQITANVTVQHWLSQDDVYFDFGPAGPLAAAQTTANYLLGATTSVTGVDLGLSLFLGGAVDGSSRFAALSADFPVSDALSLTGSFSQLWAQPGSLFAPLDGTQSLALGAEYFF